MARLPNLRYMTSLSPLTHNLTPKSAGQGPYFGQATWFLRFHSEPLASATTRYVDEILRVIGVMEDGLGRNKTGWLVGDKCTYADFAFRTWAEVGWCRGSFSEVCGVVEGDGWV
jgi:glutathione S-transferase